MADEPGRTLIAWRKVWTDETGRVLAMRYDCGHWHFQFTDPAAPMRQPRVSTMTFSPEAMDALVEGWPRFRDEVKGTK